MSHASETSGEKAPTIVRGRVDSLNIYEITDYELDTLEAGSPSSLHLNFSIALLSVGLSALVSLLTASFHSPTAQLVAIVLTIVSLIGGAFFLLSWNRSRLSTQVITKRIRARIKAQPVAEGAAAEGAPEA